MDWHRQYGMLADWWPTAPDRPATSVIFLLDNSGVIHYVRPGKEYHDYNPSLGGPVGKSENKAPCAADMAGIRFLIERLLLL